MNDITEFIPKYPEIKESKNELLNPYDENFYSALYHKKELYENKLEKLEKFPEDGGFLKSQINFSRIMSSYTPYNNILLMSEMGTGKTCASIALIEKILKSENSTFTGAMIFASGKGLLRNYKDEIVRQCTKGQYIPPNFNLLTSEEKERRINKLVYKYYDFGDFGSNLSNTFETFAKKIRRKSAQTIIDEYSNKIIVIDEVHNIRLSEYKVDEYGRRIRRKKDDTIKESVDIYKEFHRFLHLVKNCKIILMSGTPINDKIEEFADIMNLILPINDQFPTKKKFIDNYFEKKSNNEDENLLEMKPVKITEFKNKIKGYVSYLKAISSKVKKIFVGEKLGKLQYFLVYPDKMSIEQSNSYIKTFDNEDNAKKVVFNIKARQASLFVYPDGSYGEKGFKKYLKPKNKSNTSYVISKELKDALTMNCSKSYPPTDEDKEQMFKNLQKYSSKYSSCIRNLLIAYNENRSSFVYCKFIYGSGLILFTQILNLFGFSEANGNENTEGMRYIYLNFEFNTPNKIKQIKDRFNSPDNYQGKFISIIIGSEIISQGFSFFNIQEEHILTPHWNYSEIDQAIARGYRFGSHRELIKNGIEPVVRIFQYVSIPTFDKKIKKKPISIDLKLYETSEIKDINIKKLERIIKESSIDCGLNYERNFKSGNDGNRDCDYTDCNYKCDGIEQLQLSNKDLDYSTYQLYYSSFDIENISKELSLMFRNNFKISLQNIIDNFSEKYTDFKILTSLKNIINENKIIYNKYGFKSYLREDNNIFFLVDSLSVNNNYFLEYYTSNPLVSTNETFSNVINSLYVDYIPYIINKIFHTKNEEDIKNMIIKLPSNIQELLIENIIIAEDHVPKININKNIRKILLEYYKNFYKKISTKNGDIYISSYLYDEENILKCLDPVKNAWTQCSEENIKLYEEEKTDEINKLESNIY